MNANLKDPHYINGIVVQTTMLASRVLPPIVRPSPPSPPAPVATFFHVPRRYVRSNMQIGNALSDDPIDDTKPLRNQRKSNRIQDVRSIPTSSPMHPSKEEDFSPPILASPQSDRTRTASIEGTVDEQNSIPTTSTTDIRSPRSATSTQSSDFSAPHVCLCQPEPKIPRPRNAFILYRQHHQQAIIAHNPGLNNPDISKIIGEQWKAEGEESKKVWQDLALEEKARHHEQYPDYRYQPRRVGKGGSSPLHPSVQHTTVDKYRCPRCGGRSIKTPASPFLDSAGTPTLPPPILSENLTPTTRYLPMMSNLSLDSPARRRAHGPSSLSNIRVPPIREEASMYSPMTPGSKKRRFDHAPPLSSGRRPDGSYYTQYARRDSLPPIQVRYSPPNSATIMPPPRTPRDGQRPSSADISAGTNHSDQSPRSVEEVLMNFPYQNKIKLLGRISLPFNETSSTDSALQVRGAIIAVEGDDAAAVKDLAQWLNERLAKDTDSLYRPRIAEPPRMPSEEGATFEEYLDLIKEWHGKSQEMIKYITTPIDMPSSQDFIMSDKDSDKEGVADRKDSPTAPEPLGPTRASSSSPVSMDPSSSATKPVVILPTFQLAASVAYASRIPIQDAYSTTDHWQWMATLWRGTVGPDLTIYVKSHDKDQGSAKPEMDDMVRCLTVTKQKDGKFTDADLRRVGFEVSEYINGMGGKSA